jgi:hypothetical protein
VLQRNSEHYSAAKRAAAGALASASKDAVGSVYVGLAGAFVVFIVVVGVIDNYRRVFGGWRRGQGRR